MAEVNRTASSYHGPRSSTSHILSSAMMEIITVLGIAVVTMGILLSIITIQNRPTSRAAKKETRQLAVARRMSAQEAYCMDLNRAQGELTQAEVDRISGM